MKDSSIWYQYDLANERQFIRCIKHLEMLVRKSMSYAAWQKRTKYPVTECPLCGENFHYVRAESHHHPATLFDVVEGILQKHIDLNNLNDFTDFQIAEEIMQEHFAKKVEYIVLCKHCHEKYHDNVPEILETIDEAHIKQKEIINNFYNKEIGG